MNRCLRQMRTASIASAMVGADHFELSIARGPERRIVGDFEVRDSIDSDSRLNSTRIPSGRRVERVPTCQIAALYRQMHLWYDNDRTPRFAELFDRVQC